MEVVVGHQAGHHLVFVGSFGVGKTTALRAISTIEVANMDVDTEIDAYNPDKTTTTVGFDYGEVALANGDTVALFGIPGQERFAPVWDNILPDSTGTVLWLFGDQEGALAECQYWLDILKTRGAHKRLAVAVTRVAVDSDLSSYENLVRDYNPYTPIITADPRQKKSVIQAITVALSTPHYSD